MRTALVLAITTSIAASFAASLAAPFVAPATACPNCPQNKSAPMQDGFDKAHASFRDHAAHVLKLSPDRVLVSPIEADPSVQPDQQLGAAWAFYGSSKDHPNQQVRGWAVADGTIITPDQNLGLLLVEAGVWSGKPKLDANALADRLVWAMGTNHRVVGPRSLHVDPNGAGTLSFQVAYRPPGPGGAGGGPDRVSQCTVTLTADHHARLVTTAAAAPAAPSFD
jgi:hypothetical protein